MRRPAGVTAVVQHLWDHTAGVYDRAITPALADVHRAVVAALGDVRGAEALDLGCGTGRVGELLAGAGAHVTAVDLSPAMVAHARLRLSRLPGAHARVHLMDAQALELPDAAFDVVAASLSVMFCPRPDLALAGARRVLRPGGRLSMAVWGRPEECETVRVGRVAAAFGEGPEPGTPTGQSLGDPDHLRGLLEGAGFADVALRRRVMRLRYPGADALWQAVAHVHGERIPRPRMPEAEAATRAEIARVGIPLRNVAWFVTARAPGR
ncbi:MAG: methyltransferase domain-containing protein [Thermoleophilia bacterium]|nr:methyltransferase domain-containing protein [Thermoleophilia bacterium]